MTEPAESRALTRFRNVARLLDARFRVPGTGFRFGWDALIGLVPGLGDAAGGLFGAYGIWTAYSVGAPGAVLGRMLVNLAVDLAFGVIPILGDLFDVAWRGNLRNLALLERWLARPHDTGRRSAALLTAIALALAALLGATAWLLIWFLRELAARL